MAELKPCPFCGGEAGMVCLSTACDHVKTLSKVFTIQCKKCGARGQGAFRIYAEISNSGKSIFDDSEKQKAIVAWNRRAGEKETEE